MTSQPFFRRDGDSFLPNPIANGPWDPNSLHGRVIIGLLAFAIEQSSADRMRGLEQEQAHLWASTRETRKDKPFVRSAKSGGWKAELSEASVAEIESAWGGLMRDIGYELSLS